MNKIVKHISFGLLPFRSYLVIVSQQQPDIDFKDTLGDKELWLHLCTDDIIQHGLDLHKSE